MIYKVQSPAGFAEEYIVDLFGVEDFHLAPFCLQKESFLS